MAELKTYVLQKGFNQVFNRMENCELVPAPFDKHINTGYTYASKRKGLAAYRDITVDISMIGKFIDSTTNTDLALTASAVYSFTSSAHTSIEAISSDGYGASIGLLPSGTLVLAATATGGSPTTLTGTITGGGANAFAGYYIWLNGGVGIGDIQQITASDATTITVNGWTDAITPTAATTFRIYPKLCFETLITSSLTDAQVKFYDGTDMRLVTGINNFIKSITHDGRQWYLDASNTSIVWYSLPGQPLIIDSFIDTGFDPCLDIVSHGTYIIIGKAKRFTMIRKEIIAAGTEVYIHDDLIAALGLINTGAMSSSLGSFYFIGNDKKLYLLDIIATESHIIGKPSNQGLILKGYLDELDGTEKFSFLNIGGDLHIIAGHTGTTVEDKYSYEFIYSTDYESWLVNTYAYYISSITDTPYYAVGDTVCTLSETVKSDLGVDYEQIIKVIFGLDNQWVLHHIDFLKIIVGVQRDSHLEVRLRPYAVFSFLNLAWKDLKLDLKIDPLLPDSVSGLGIYPLGISLLGGSIDPAENFTMTGIVKYDLYDYANGFLFEIEFSDRATPLKQGFIFGGTAIQYTDAAAVEHLYNMVV